MRETEISQPRDGPDVAFDQPSGEGVAPAKLTGWPMMARTPVSKGPGTRGPESGTGRHQRSDEGARLNSILGSLDVGVDIEDPPGTLGP